MMEQSAGDNDTTQDPEAHRQKEQKEAEAECSGPHQSPYQPPHQSPSDVWSSELTPSPAEPHASPAELPAPVLFCHFDSRPADGDTVDQRCHSNGSPSESVKDKDACHNGANQLLSSQTDCSSAKDSIKRSQNRPSDLDLQPMTLTLKQLVFRKDVINRNRQNWVICDEEEEQRNGETAPEEAESKLGWDDQNSDSPDSWNYEKTSPAEENPDHQNEYASEPLSDSSDSNSNEEPSPVNTPPPRKSSGKKTKLMALQRRELQQDKTVLAPPLNDNLQFHAFFMYHHSDRDWVLNVIEKLESPALGFHCCCYERDLNSNLSQPQGILYGMKHSLKTIIILSPEFVMKMWTSCEAVIGDVDVITLQKDFVLVLLADCEVPDVLTMANFVRANKQGWWTRFLARLALPDDTPMTEETVLSMSSSLVGLTPGLQSGHLLSSLKSKCQCCGHETIDSTEVPDELLAHGIQIPPDEFQEAVGGLMCEAKFRCHTWCYNMPLAIIFFALLLGLSLAVVPVIEAKLVFGSPQAGMEYLHGAIVWLCILTIYMFLNHISRRKMKRAMYGKLAKVNTVFIKYNILTGVENLGLADCNKYYLHFFYYELGPCLGYLQELLGNVEEYQPSFTNCVLELDSGAGDGEEGGREICEEDNGHYENITVHLHNNNTNVSMQNQAEDLLLDHSGEYIYRLITKKLDRPRKQRHVKGSYCLCQFVEHRVYKMVV